MHYMLEKKCSIARDQLWNSVTMAFSTAKILTTTTWWQRHAESSNFVIILWSSRFLHFKFITPVQQLLK